LALSDRGGLRSDVHRIDAAAVAAHREDPIDHLCHSAQSLGQTSAFHGHGIDFAGLVETNRKYVLRLTSGKREVKVLTVPVSPPRLQFQRGNQGSRVGIRTSNDALPVLLGQLGEMVRNKQVDTSATFADLSHVQLCA
jgi:hypothetical protein